MATFLSLLEKNKPPKLISFIGEYLMQQVGWSILKDGPAQYICMSGVYSLIYLSRKWLGRIGSTPVCLCVRPLASQPIFDRGFIPFPRVFVWKWLQSHDWSLNSFAMILQSIVLTITPWGPPHLAAPLILFKRWKLVWLVKLLKMSPKWDWREYHTALEVPVVDLSWFIHETSP